MRRDTTSAEVVAHRLEQLRALYVPETQAETQRRLREPPRERPFEEAVERRLAELRALCELSAYLSQRRSA